MSEQENLEIVRRGYEAFGRGDMETLLSFFDEDIVWSSPGPSDLPTAGIRRGRQEVVNFFHDLNELYDIQRFEPKTFVAKDDLVVVLGEDTHRIKATGKILDAEWAHVFTVRDGKIVSFREYLDTAADVAELRAAVTRT